MAIVPFTDPELKGVVGGHVNSEEWNAVTRIATAAGIGKGQPVSRDGDFGIAAFDGELLGVTRHHIAVDDEEGFPATSSVPVMTMGVMWVAAGGDCTAGAPAFYDAATDRWSDDTGVAVPGVEFDSSGGDGSLVKIRIMKTSAAPVAP